MPVNIKDRQVKQITRIADALEQLVSPKLDLQPSQEKLDDLLRAVGDVLNGWGPDDGIERQLFKKLNDAFFTLYHDNS